MAVLFCVPTSSEFRFLLLYILTSISCHHCFGLNNFNRCVVVSWCNLRFSNGISYALLLSAYLLEWGIQTDFWSQEWGNISSASVSWTDYGETIWAGAFCLGRLLIIDLVPLIDKCLLRFCIFLWDLIDCVFQEICPFYPNWWENNVVHNTLLLFF